MDGIVTGKVEKSAGTLEFKAAIHQDMVAGDTSLQIETTDLTLDYFKLVMIDDTVMIGTMHAFSDVTFTAGDFTGVNAIIIENKIYQTQTPNFRRFTIHSPNYNYSISGAFKYLEIGTLS